MNFSESRRLSTASPLPPESPTNFRSQETVEDHRFSQSTVCLGVFPQARPYTMSGQQTCRVANVHNFFFGFASTWSGFQEEARLGFCKSQVSREVLCSDLLIVPQTGLCGRGSV